MFDKVQESLKRSKDERQKKRLEKERVRLEKAAAEARRRTSAYFLIIGYHRNSFNSNG